MLINHSKTMVLWAILCALLAGVPVAAEDIVSYAKTCNAKVEVEVKGFDCSKGELIPMEGVAGGKCKKPPYLTTAPCREGSRFGVQIANESVAVVWLCRKKKVTNPNSEIFDDIAIIQTNFKNGATCFYQKLGNVDGSNVPAPVDDKMSFWMPPAKAAAEECASCHDSGLLRTPYLTQLTTKPNVIPQTRQKENYWFPGTDFVGWNGRVYKVSVKGTTCTGCHIMGANAIDPEVGTSSWLGPMSTGTEETPNLEGMFAFWMKPKLHAPDQASKDAAELIKKCALDVKVAGCERSLWGGQVTAIIESQKGRTLPALRQPPAQEEPKPQDK
jgi:hypothetical protein